MLQIGFPPCNKGGSGVLSELWQECHAKNTKQEEKNK